MALFYSVFWQLKQTAMKADEIRRLIINDLFLNMFDEDAEYTLERIDEYAAEVSRDKCDGCVFSYHNKSKGSHDVEDLYKEQEEPPIFNEIGEKPC